MYFRPSDSVRAFLPLAVLAFCHAGCGGGGGSGTTGSGSQAPSAPLAGHAAPTISGDAPAYARVGRSYEFQPTFNDPDGDPLIFSATNLPPWASLDAHSGRITGTPAAGDLGAYEDI